jgi:hypothetical protein
VVSLLSGSVAERKVEKSMRGMCSESCETAVVMEEDMVGDEVVTISRSIDWLRKREVVTEVLSDLLSLISMGQEIFFAPSKLLSSSRTWRFTNVESFLPLWARC